MSGMAGRAGSAFVRSYSSLWTVVRIFNVRSLSRASSSTRRPRDAKLWGAAKPGIRGVEQSLFGLADDVGTDDLWGSDAMPPQLDGSARGLKSENDCGFWQSNPPLRSVSRSRSSPPARIFLVRF
jgi:hypothetical protein